MDPVTVTFPIGLKSADDFGVIDLDTLINHGSTGAELVPTQRAPLAPYAPPIDDENVIYLKEELLESLRDGRAIIYTGMAICTALALVVLYLFIASVLAVVHMVVAAATTLLTIAVAIALVLWLCREPKGPEELYLKGCPTRSPGVHKVKLCNGRH